MLTMEQATRELNANTWAIAKAIRQQQSDGSAEADQLIKSYEAGLQGSEEGKTTFLTLYTTWRNENSTLVTPTAQELGHESPSFVITPAAATSAGSPFDVAPAPAPSATVETPERTAQHEGETEKPAPPEKPQTRKQRNAWAQTDIVDLTRALLTAKEGQHTELIAAFAGGRGRSVKDVTDKAVELKLIEAPPATEKYELSETDKRVLKSRLLNGAMVADNLTTEQRIVHYRFIAQEAREIVKSLSEESAS